MLPIVSTPSAQHPRTNNRRSLAVQSIVHTEEALSGDWQRAKAHRRAKQQRTFEGELSIDSAAVESYLSAAGEQIETVSGSLLSVYA